MPEGIPKFQHDHAEYKEGEIIVSANPENKNISTEGINPEFKKSLEDFYRDFLGPRSSMPSLMNAFRKQEVILKDGSVVEIAPFIGVRELSSSEKLCVMIVSFAKNTDKKIEGYRRLVGEYEGEKKTLIISGEISTARTGIGLGNAIENNTIKTLQDISNQEGIRIEWKITNGNRFDLLRLENMSREYPGDLDVQKNYTQKKAEQLAWQKLYGINGKFGFTPTELVAGETDQAVKIFTPQVGFSSTQNKRRSFLDSANVSSPEVDEYLENVKEQIFSSQ